MTRFASLLSTARHALQQGDAVQADGLYRTCLEHDLPVYAEYAGLCYTRKDFARAHEILDRGLAALPGDAHLHFLRGLVKRAQAMHRGAIEDFDAALAADAALVPARLNRAHALLALERIAEAIAEMERVCLLAPSNADAWTDLGLMQLRTEDWPRAIHALETAQRLEQDRPVVLRSLASALTSAGDATAALPLLARAEMRSPHDPATLTDHALGLLRCGRLGDAVARCVRALEIDPGDQTALALLYMLHLERGEHSAAEKLMNYSGLLGQDSRRDSDRVDLDALRVAILSHPDLVWEPAGRATIGGEQSAKLDLSSGGPFASLHRMLARAVDSRIRELRSDPDLAGHPWVDALPDRWSLQAWATVLHDAGRQTPHIHPAGRMSGVFYLDTGDRASSRGGHLVFGHPQPDLPLTAPPLEHVHAPAAGQILTFPSYFLHHTTPYHGAGVRISLAFDVMPE